MRTITAGEMDLLLSDHYSLHLRVHIQRGEESINLCDLDGINWLHEINISDDIDRGIKSISVQLERNQYWKSLVPVITGSKYNQFDGGYVPLVDLSRQILIEYAVTSTGSTPAPGDWRVLERGIVDAVNFGSSPISLECRDLGGIIEDTFIEEERIYGGTAHDPAPIQGEMQQILDDNGLDHITLEVIGDPNWGIGPYLQEKVPVLKALRDLAEQFGWATKYRYNETSQDMEFTLYDIDRIATAPLYTFGPTDYFDISSLNVNLRGIRNAVRIVFFNVDTSEKDTIIEEDGTSQDRYGRRYCEITEDATEGINWREDAINLAEIILHDLCDTKADKQAELPYLPVVQTGDRYKFLPNGIHYDVDMHASVVGYSHVLGRDRKRTTLTMKGEFEVAASAIGFYSEWLRKETRPGIAPSNKFHAPEDPHITWIFDGKDAIFKWDWPDDPAYSHTIVQVVDPGDPAQEDEAEYWEAQKEYNVGDYVMGTNNLVYQALNTHIATYDNRPVSGEDWGDHWELSPYKIIRTEELTDTKFIYSYEENIEDNIGDVEEWASGVGKSPGDKVYGTDGLVYHCHTGHTTSPDNRPITGEDWEDVWDTDPLWPKPTVTIRVTHWDINGNRTAAVQVTAVNAPPPAPAVLIMSSTLSMIQMSVPNPHLPDFQHVEFELATDEHYADAVVVGVGSNFTISVPARTDGINYGRARYMDAFGQYGSYTINMTSAKLIEREWMQGAIFQINPSSDPDPISGTLEELWDMDTTTGPAFDAPFSVEFEYPMHWLFDMVRFYATQEAIYSVYIYDDDLALYPDPAGWVCVIDEETSVEDDWTVRRFVDTSVPYDPEDPAFQMFVARRVKIAFGSALQLTELKFWTIVLADEILAQNMTLTDTLQILGAGKMIVFNGQEFKAIDRDTEEVTFHIDFDGRLSTRWIKADYYEDIRNVMPYNYLDSLDEENPLICDFYIPSERKKEEGIYGFMEIKFTGRGLQFRSYSKTAAGGATGEENTGSFEQKHEHTIGFDLTPDIETDGESPTCSEEPDHSHSYDQPPANTGSTAHSHAFSGSTDNESPAHAHSISTTETTTGKKSVGISGSTGTGGEDDHVHGSGSLSGSSHDHSYSEPFSFTGSRSHSHDFSGSTDNESPAHSHSIVTSSEPTGVAGKHLHTIGNHVHGYARRAAETASYTDEHSHTFSVSNHTHGLTYGIYLNTTPDDVKLYVDDGTGSWVHVCNFAEAPSPPTAPYTLVSNGDHEIDLSSYFTEVGWKRIKLESSRRGRINAQIHIKVDITA